MVNANPAARVRCTSARCHPAKTNQITFQMIPSTPVPMSSTPVTDLRSISRRPNGQQEKVPSMKHARVHGRPMMVNAIKMPTTYHQMQEIAPPSKNQIKFPSVLILKRLQKA